MQSSHLFSMQSKQCFGKNKLADFFDVAPLKKFRRLALHFAVFSNYIIATVIFNATNNRVIKLLSHEAAC